MTPHPHGPDRRQVLVVCALSEALSVQTPIEKRFFFCWCWCWYRCCWIPFPSNFQHKRIRELKRALLPSEIRTQARPFGWNRCVRCRCKIPHCCRWIGHRLQADSTVESNGPSRPNMAALDPRQREDRPPKLRLVTAVRDGRLESITSLLRGGALTEQVDEMGLTPLLAATRAGNTAAIEVLLDAVRVFESLNARSCFLLLFFFYSAFSFFHLFCNYSRTSLHVYILLYDTSSEVRPHQ